MKHFLYSKVKNEGGSIKFRNVYPTNTRGFGVSAAPNKGGMELSPAQAMPEQKV